MLVKCEVCGKELRRSPSQVKKNNYCSKKCNGEHLKNRVALRCEMCGKQFECPVSEAKDRKSCGMECRAKLLETKRTRVAVNCEICGKQFERVPSQLKTRNFCSGECCAKSNIKELEHSPKRIFEMYWKEGVSILGIAQKAGTSRTVITRILKETNSIRSMSEAQKLVWKRRPINKMKALAAMRSKSALARKGKPILIGTHQKMMKGAIKTNTKPLITKNCCNPNCTNTVTGKPGRFTGKHTFYCSIGCGVKDAARRRKEREQSPEAIPDVRFL